MRSIAGGFANVLAKGELRSSRPFPIHAHFTVEGNRSVPPVKDTYAGQPVRALEGAGTYPESSTERFAAPLNARCQ